MGYDLELTPLDESGCWQRIATVSLARIAVDDPPHAPLVLPVNIRVDGPTITFRSDDGTKIQRLRADPRVSIEADMIDIARQTGWSVLVRGRAVIERPPDDVLERRDPHPWVGEGQEWVQVSVDEITGRQIRLREIPDTPRDRLGYL